MTEKYNQDGSLNENWLAEEIAEWEGKKEEQNIAQIKEILKITLEILADETPEQIDTLLGKHDKKLQAE